jgi:hypothetical protein
MELVKEDLVKKLDTGEITPEDAWKASEQLFSHRVYKLKGPTERYNNYKNARNIRDQILESKVPFISPQFLPDFTLCQGAILVGGVSGQGKSTIAGNLLAGFLTACPGQQSLLISNEEADDAVYDRIAAVLMKKDFRAIHKRKGLSRREVDQVEGVIQTAICPNVDVVGESEFDTTCIEDVVDIMESAARSGVKFILIDYHQNIDHSRADPAKDSFKVSKALGRYYKVFGMKYGIPVVVFVQLAEQHESAKMKQRIENDKTLFNHGFINIEAVPDFDTNHTTFKIHKDRFNGCTGKEVIMKFEGGRFVVAAENV